ncbi:hypothetical protein TNCV_5105521 [Trichonephila clavipes]|nr:hypothetical protein TNCV_5105521 [Trichonephila clavipes]
MGHNWATYKGPVGHRLNIAELVHWSLSEVTVAKLHPLLGADHPRLALMVPVQWDSTSARWDSDLESLPSMEECQIQSGY